MSIFRIYLDGNKKA
ncbi:MULTISPECIES: hypothetical protein [Escherichia]|nr:MULTISPECIES: hypothetical protein [Escherichia]